ncbi:hypothetical protein CEAn_00171 [Coxiella endosymbiont of Amblyomma nuttalli]|nr:hypothetical protein CEAn_00171 [Coxiella endosymbiont of Amblyomma nuttalli]
MKLSSNNYIMQRMVIVGTEIIAALLIFLTN